MEHRAYSDLATAELMGVDPGNAGKLEVSHAWVQYRLKVTSGVETRTLNSPTKEGQRVTLVCEIAVGGTSVAVTSAVGINHAGNNTMTFNSDNECCILESIPDGSGSGFRWVITVNDGSVALS